MKLLLRIISAIVVLIIVLALARNIIVKSAVGSIVRSMTGVSVQIKGLDIGLFKPVISVKDMKLLNSREYPESLMMDMPQLYVDYDLGQILKGTIHLRDLRINLQEFVVVKNDKGVMNVESLKALQPKGEGKPPQVKIDVLDLSIGKVVYKEYAPGATAPTIKEFNINIHERYQNITDANALVSLILVKALRNTSISGVSGIVGTANNILDNTAGKLLRSGVTTTNKITDSLNKFLSGGN